MTRRRLVLALAAAAALAACGRKGALKPPPAETEIEDQAKDKPLGQ